MCPSPLHAGARSLQQADQPDEPEQLPDPQTRPAPHRPSPPSTARRQDHLLPLLVATGPLTPGLATLTYRFAQVTGHSAIILSATFCAGMKKERTLLMMRSSFVAFTMM
jgi:hypothetical protein